MQVAAQVGELDQLRQLARRARLRSSPQILAQLGRNPGQPDGGVDRLLGLAGDPALAAEHAVLVDLEAPLLRHAPDRDVVRLGAGEVQQRRAVALVRASPARPPAGRSSGSRWRASRRSPGPASRPRNARSARIAAAVLAAMTSRSRSPTVSFMRRKLPAVSARFDARHVAQVARGKPRRTVRLAELEARTLREMRAATACEDLLLGLLPEAVQRRGSGRPRAAFSSCSSVWMSSSCHSVLTRFGPRPGTLEQLRHRGRHLPVQLLERTALAGLQRSLRSCRRGPRRCRECR